jgi:hypothetical protein
VSFSCLLARIRPLNRAKSLVNGLFVVEVAGFEPTWAQMWTPRSGGLYTV